MNIETIPIIGSCLLVLYFVFNAIYQGFFVYDCVKKLGGNHTKGINPILIKDLFFFSIGFI